MVDFVKVITRNCNVSYLEAHPDLDFVGSYYCDTGESIPKKEATDRGMKFILYDSGILKMQGSLHKYKNDGLHNYDDFTYTQLVGVLSELLSRFQLRLEDCMIRNFETGVNVIMKQSPKSLLNRLLTHKNTAFKDVSQKNGHIKQAEHSQYIFKIYDKGLQNKLKENILRVELKFTRMHRLNKIGLYNLSDLLNKSIYNDLEQLLTSEWANVLLFEEPLVNAILSPIQRQRKQYQWQNPNYWLQLIKQERFRQLKQYKNYVPQKTLNEHNSIKKMINQKFIELLNK